MKRELKNQIYQINNVKHTRKKAKLRSFKCEKLVVRKCMMSV